MAARRIRSGTWLAAAMIGFGVLLTAGLYTYLKFHTAPFRSLANALAAKYPDASPRVDGGKPRLDEPGAAVLRIVMKSPVDPQDEVAAKSFAHEVAAFAAANHDLSRYEEIEIHLFRGRREEELSQRTVHVRVEEVVAPGGATNAR